MGHKPTGGRVEIFLLKQLDDAGAEWECLVRGRNLNVGAEVTLDPQQTGEPHAITATILAVEPSGARRCNFPRRLHDCLDDVGEIPLPPYITDYQGDRERYQTVYNRTDGSVAAPTAGLHFTPELLMQLRRQGVEFDTVTLHVGLDTFQPVTVEEVEDAPDPHRMGRARARCRQTHQRPTLQGGRVVAVGTTSVRTLEWAATGAQGHRSL